MSCVRGSLAHLGWRPILLTGLFRQVLIHHFARLGNLEDPALADPDVPAIWRDTLKTGILIESVHRWRGELVEKRPAVLVKRNAFRNLRVTIGDRHSADKRGNEHFVTLWVGSHTLFCIHGSGAGAEILAAETQRELTQFGPVLTQQLDLKKLQVVEVGAVGEVEESQQSFVVPITVGWAYQEAWQLEPEELRLSGVVFQVNANDC